MPDLSYNATDKQDPGKSKRLFPMVAPSLEVLRNAVVVLGLVALGTGITVYLLMQVRYDRQLTLEARRLMLTDLLSPSWDDEVLREMWRSSRKHDREILADLVVIHRQALEDQDAGAFERAVMSTGIYDYWVQRLSRGAVRERLKAAVSLGHFHDERGVQALIAAARDPSPEVARAVALSLGRLGAPTCLPGVLALLARAPNPIPDLTLAASLAACARGCPSRLIPVLTAHEERLRILGARALSVISDATVLPQLCTAAQDPSVEVRSTVARALARVSHPDAIEALLFLTRDPVWFVRLRALDSLGKLQAPAGKGAALAGLSDASQEVRYRAAFALRQIAGMKAGIIVEARAAGARRGLISLISEWERGGFLWRTVSGLKTRDWVRFKDCKELLEVLISAGFTRALIGFVQVFPDLKVRLRLLRLLAAWPRADVRAALLAIASQPGCDPRVGAAIRREFLNSPAADSGRSEQQRG